MTSTPEQPDAVPASAEELPDERLLAAHDVALRALHEITRPETVGDPAGYRVESDGVVSLLFENRMPGYPGWFWTASLAVVPDAEPTVLETELLPGETALLAPEWVPWAVRLAEYQAQQAAVAAVEGEAADAAAADELDEVVDDVDGDEDDLDEDDLDEDADDDEDVVDFDADDSPILHAGDLDGVDIDELDPSAEDYDDEDEEDSEDEDDSDNEDDSDDADDSDDDDFDEDDSDEE
jgi:hypothetical protein